jgi:hypothetical protein
VKGDFAHVFGASLCGLDLIVNILPTSSSIQFFFNDLPTPPLPCLSYLFSSALSRFFTVSYTRCAIPAICSINPLSGVQPLFGFPKRSRTSRSIPMIKPPSCQPNIESLYQFERFMDGSFALISVLRLIVVYRLRFRSACVAAVISAPIRGRGAESPR